MRSQFDLMKDIVSLSKDDLEQMAKAIAFFNIRKAEQFQEAFEIAIEEEQEERTEILRRTQAA
jgi:hypothetical protein